MRSFLEETGLILGHLNEFGNECCVTAGIVRGNTLQLKVYKRIRKFVGKIIGQKLILSFRFDIL